jgi:hypothetical protein
MKFQPTVKDVIYNLLSKSPQELKFRLRDEQMKFKLLILLVFIGGIIGFFRSIYRRSESEKREASLKSSGPQVQAHSFPKEDPISEFKKFHSSPTEDLVSRFKQSTGVMRFVHEEDVAKCLFGKEGATNLMEGSIGSIDFVIFDYEYLGDEGLATHFHLADPYCRGTAVLLQSEQISLPTFKYGKDSRQRERFHPKPPLKAKEKAGSKQCPTCGNWGIRGGAMVEHGGIGDWCDHCKKSLYKMNEEEARKLLRVLPVSELRGWEILASNTQLLLYLDGVMVAVEKYEEFMEKALNIFRLFQSSSQNLNEDA